MGKKVDTKKYYLNDPSNVMMMGKISNYDEESKHYNFNEFKFLRDNKDIKLFVDLKEGDVIEIFKNDERWTKVSKEYYDRAKRIIDEWNGDVQVFVMEEKDAPILIAGDDLGFALAPRIELE